MFHPRPNPMKVKVNYMYKQKESTERRFFVSLGDVVSIDIRVLVHGLYYPVFVLPVTDRLFKKRVTSLIFRWQPIWPR